MLKGFWIPCGVSSSVYFFFIQHHNLRTSFTTELFVDVHDGAPLHVLGLTSSRDLRLSGAQHAIVRIIFLIDSYYNMCFISMRNAIGARAHCRQLEQRLGAR